MGTEILVIFRQLCCQPAVVVGEQERSLTVCFAGEREEERLSHESGSEC